jgi:hypothetical protein
MAFDINQQLFDRDGLPREKKVGPYIDGLMELFVESPEGQALRDEGAEPGWAAWMMEYAINYVGVTPPQMSPDDLREVLFELFPQKVSTPASEAEAIVRELRAFWTFLQREFHLANAAGCLKVLDEKAGRRLKKELSNPANFGIAKSFVMMGLERGFDISSEEGINQWMETYNAELASGAGLRIPLPGEQSESARQFHEKVKPAAAGTIGTTGTTGSKRKQGRKRVRRRK